MAVLTKEHALAIARKLQADIRTKRKAHDLAVVYVDGLRVTQFGIRRGSQKNLGHDHLPNGLKVSTRQCLELAQCSMSRDDWIEVLKAKELV